jgi:hypothetical protein
MPDEFFSLPSCLVPDEKEVFVFKIKILWKGLRLYLKFLPRPQLWAP